MNFRKIDAAIFPLFLVFSLPALATTTYTYSDNNPIFSGSFSVDSQLADGSYNFLSIESRPTGFAENFFTNSFLDGRNVTRTPTISHFDITIDNGKISNWDIRATTLFTSVTYSTGGRGTSKVYHDNSVLIYHDTNLPYLPGNGLAYQSVIARGDYKTYYTAGFAYQESLTGAWSEPGVWSTSSSTLTPVPEPETYAMLLAGLGLMGAVARRKQK